MLLDDQYKTVELFVDNLMWGIVSLDQDSVNKFTSEEKQKSQSDFLGKF